MPRATLRNDHNCVVHGQIHLIPSEIFAELGSAGYEVMLPIAVWRAHKHEVERHRRAMLGLFFGALVIAGLFTFMPGRIMHEVMFGS
jgi:uncharacterized membrane protein